MPKISRLAGILCVGQNHNQAVENFRKTALGQSTMFYASKDGVAYASQSGVDLYNPNGGNELLNEHPDLVEKAEFASESSNAGDVKAFYTICLDGCGSHVISDSSANITGSCPSCSADLSEITDERVHDFLSESAASEQAVEHAGLVATGKTAEAAQRNFAQAISNSHAFTALSNSGSFNAATAAKFDPYTGAQVHTNEPQEAPESVTALSSAGDEIEAHMYSCSAKCEQPFTVSSDEEPVFCAHCSAALLDDVASESGDDDSDIDIIDEDDLEEEDDVSDDEDFDSESGSDDDEEEDDLDDEDLDEDDLDDEDFDEDDLDDEDFDSESGSDDEELDEDIDDEEDLDEEDLDDEDLDDEDFDSESGSDDESDDDVDFDDDEDLEEEDLDLDDEDFDSESGAVSRTFDSLSAAQATHGNLDPTLVSLSRATGGKVDSVYLNYDGMPVARATFASVSNAVGEETAAKNFATDNFIRAVSVSLNQNGVTETCSSFGFMPFTIEMPVEKLLVAQSDARVSEATDSVSSTIADAIEANKERFIAALSSAQLGVVKNYWGDVRNPIVESLCSSLQAVGLKDPRAIVERAFIAHGKDFLSVSTAKAIDLMSKSEVAQNEISESIDAAAGTVSAKEVQNVVHQEPVTLPKAATTAANLLNNEPDVVSQSSASPDSKFEDKLKRMSF